MPKQMDESLMRKGIFEEFQRISLTITYKGKHCNSTMEKHVGYHLK